MSTCYRVSCKKHVSISRACICYDCCFAMTSKRRRSETSQPPVFRFSLDVRFSTESEKEAFIARLTSVRDLFSPEGGEKVHNYELLSQLFSLAETRPLSRPSQAVVSPQSSSTTNMLAANGEMFWKLLYCMHMLK